MKTPTCCHCDGPADRITGADIYRGRRDLADRYFWHCESCNAYVGCHPGTDKPLGELAKYATRQARMKAHLFFDPIWRGLMKQGLSKSRARKQAYGWLSAQLGGGLSNISSMDEQTCVRVIEICKAHTGKPLISPLPGDENAYNRQASHR